MHRTQNDSDSGGHMVTCDAAVVRMHGMCATRHICMAVIGSSPMLSCAREQGRGCGCAAARRWRAARWSGRTACAAPSPPSLACRRPISRATRPTGMAVSTPPPHCHDGDCLFVCGQGQGQGPAVWHVLLRRLHASRSQTHTRLVRSALVHVLSSHCQAAAYAQQRIGTALGRPLVSIAARLRTEHVLWLLVQRTCYL